MTEKDFLYEEVIRQSQANVKALSEKLKAFDKLHDDIVKLKNDNNKLPKFFDDKFKEISKLSDDYTRNLGTTSGEYLQKNNQLFTSKISELSSKIKDIEAEITRLEKTDFVGLFKGLQNDFIKTTRTDLNKELNKFDSKITDLQNNISNFKNRIGDLKTEITRLENIDLEKHFDKLQKTLSDIFGAINSLNTSFTTVIQTLNTIVQSNSNIQTKAEKNAKDIKSEIEKLSDDFGKQLLQQKEEITENRELFESKVEKLELQNENIIKGIKTNRLIAIIGIGIITALLIIHFFMK